MSLNGIYYIQYIVLLTTRQLQKKKNTVQLT